MSKRFICFLMIVSFLACITGCITVEERPETTVKESEVITEEPKVVIEEPEVIVEQPEPAAEKPVKIK